MGKTSFGYRRLEEILKTNCAASAEEITAAMKCDLPLGRVPMHEEMRIFGGV